MNKQNSSEPSGCFCLLVEVAMLLLTLTKYLCVRVVVLVNLDFEDQAKSRSDQLVSAFQQSKWYER